MTASHSGVGGIFEAPREDELSSLCSKINCFKIKVKLYFFFEWVYIEEHFMSDIWDKPCWRANSSQYLTSVLMEGNRCNHRKNQATTQPSSSLAKSKAGESRDWRFKTCDEKTSDLNSRRTTLLVKKIWIIHCSLQATFFISPILGALVFRV